MKKNNAISLNCICYLLKSLLSSLIFFTTQSSNSQQNENVVIDESSPYHINTQTLNRTLIGGDTIFVSSSRTKALKFQNIYGNAQSPVVVINSGGQVKIDEPSAWGGVTFENCKFIKISGSGYPAYKYGFELAGYDCGLAFTELSSDCEAEFVKISHDGFFGIYAKKDYDGNPPFPYPVFENLIIHDCFIEGVSEGMYLGETKTPGMEFKHVKIYNNIVRNTLRESIQIANMVEDVEIYNNTMLNAGLDNINWHTNILQIGDNSVVNAYNNILSNAPAFGIINMGKGDCTFTNNYISSNLGVFNDDRSISDTLATINIQQNYFRSITSSEIVRNLNQINYLNINDNNYDTNVPFYLNQTDNPNNFALSNNTLTTVYPIEFTDAVANDYSLAQGTPVEYENIGASGGSEFFEYIDPILIPKKITVTPDMVTDLVSGGSVNSPLFLFDEQNLDVQAGEHAISDSWKPYYTMDNAPYHVIVDLGQEYDISKIFLHDMHSVFDFTIEYVNSSNWAVLFTDPCDTFNAWSENSTNVTTRYLRLSMLQSPYASVNEIIIYGLPAIKESEQIVITPNMITDLVQGGSVNSPLFLFDEQNLDIQAGEHAISDSWKPFYNETNAPYHVVLDLGQEYSISKIFLHDMHSVFDFSIEYGDPSSWTTLFTDPCDTFNTWSENSTDVSTQYLRLSMLQSPYAAVNEIIIYGYSVNDKLPIEEEEVVVYEYGQIIVDSSMVTDLVQSGSVYSPLFLFDEQNLDIQAGEHAVSDSWKPYYTIDNAPYHVVVDLGQEYNVSKVFLHDMHSVFDFTIEYGNPSSWVVLFTDPCDTFNTWSENSTDVSTQYLRLSMLQSPYAAVNEIILFGTPISTSASKFSEGKKGTVELGNSEKLELFPNPVDQKIHLKFPVGMVGTNIVQIKDVLGKILYSKTIKIDSENPFIEFNNSQIPLVSGYYILSSQNESGEFRTVKFIKK